MPCRRPRPLGGWSLALSSSWPPQLPRGFLYLPTEPQPTCPLPPLPVPQKTWGKAPRETPAEATPQPAPWASLSGGDPSSRGEVAPPAPRQAQQPSQCSDLPAFLAGQPAKVPGKGPASVRLQAQAGRHGDCQLLSKSSSTSTRDTSGAAAFPHRGPSQGPRVSSGPARQAHLRGDPPAWVTGPCGGGVGLRVPTPRPAGPRAGPRAGGARQPWPHLPAMALVLPCAQQEPQYWGMCWLRVTLA